MCADAAGQRSRARVFDGVLRGEALIGEPMGDMEGEGIGVELEALFILAEGEGDEVLPLCRHGEITAAGEAVLCHLVGRVAKADFAAVGKAAHNGEQDGIAARPVGGSAAPNVFRAALVAEGNQFAAKALGDGGEATKFQSNFHRVSSLPILSTLYDRARQKSSLFLTGEDCFRPMGQV